MVRFMSFPYTRAGFVGTTDRPNRGVPSADSVSMLLSLTSVLKEASLFPEPSHLCLVLQKPFAWRTCQCNLSAGCSSIYVGNAADLLSLNACCKVALERHDVFHAVRAQMLQFKVFRSSASLFQPKTRLKLHTSFLLQHSDGH